MKTRLLSNKEMSSEYIESARQLSRLKCSGFIAEEIYAAQIELMAADVVPGVD